MKLEVASLSHIGQVRQRNEDALGHFEPTEKSARDEKGSIFVVADGMGGHRGGEIASKLAVETIISEFYSSKEGGVVPALRLAFKEANKVIIEKSKDDVDLFGMGTTCTVLVVRNDDAYFAHIGDSRAYLYRDGELKQITEDHSLVGEMVRSGIISDEDARNHPRRNVITRSLGTHEEISADIPTSPFGLADGDVLLLCSDGLTSVVTREEVKKTLESKSPRDACDALVDLANEKGGKDNITVQVIKVSADG
ncbi:MAG: Stp1/IreP family PP2C-type Ser/Thr phosphatase [Candidatus Latescibacterota bacterium]|nr:MAG: Stp1/IreP family PP2C-type Ser/Thr phosphatase [Candidatus Latescibacterota bacterium]